MNRFDSPVLQYALGVAVNLAYFGVLLCNVTTAHNLHYPTGRYAENLWAESDVVSYGEPARNYLEHGLFGYGDLPDNYRTIGYPAFLALMMAWFGSNWELAAIVVQCLVGAVAYPAMSTLARLLFPNLSWIGRAVFWSLLATGVYWTRVTVLMTDVVFAALLAAGVCTGMLSVARGSWGHAVLHWLLIGVAAQVRPSLVVYPVVVVFLLWSAARLGGGRRTARRAWIGGLTMLMVTAAVLAPAVRNYRNYGILKTTIVWEINHQRFGRQVLSSAAPQREYEIIGTQKKRPPDLAERMRRQKAIAYATVREFPMAALMRVLRNAGSFALQSHYHSVGNFAGYHWRALSANGQHPQRGSLLLLTLNLASIALMSVVYAAYGAWVIGLALRRYFLFAMTALILPASLLAPALLVGGGPRIRTPAEGFLMIGALAALACWRRRHGAPDRWNLVERT